MNGFDVCREVRHRGVTTPILMLTAKGQVVDKVVGLKLGADDYLTKPFEFPELFARVRALVRRGPGPRPVLLAAGGLELDPAAHTAMLDGEPLELTAKEFAILEYFMRHPGEALPRRRLIDHVWDYAYQGDSNVVDVYIRRLRAKLGEETLETVRGVGYRLCDRAPAAASA